MRPGENGPARTVLEQQIRQRHETFEEFAETVEKFAREHGERGTISARHVQRLAAGHYPDGRPLGPVRPATARLLHRLFGLTMDELLAPPSTAPTAHVLRIAIAVVVTESDVLAVQRRGSESDTISWQFPAGIVKPERGAESTAVRETLNETGIRCLTARPMGSRLHPVTHVVCDYLLCEYLAGNAINADPDENADVAWIDKDTLTRLIPADQIYPPVLEALGLIPHPVR